ncbi:MAG: SNF2-related protein [Thermoguttaceae bacterium]|nr:SNF2-related protein [Thermoguttaceae bacterium]
MDKILTLYNQLSAAANIDQYRLHLAAWEWSVIEPIIIRNESDIQSHTWRECGLTPFKHQFQNLIYFFRKMPCSLIADDVGLGKTISAALILSELISRKRVLRALIIAPKILCYQWKGELQNLFGLDSCIAETGKEFERLVSSKDCSILITTYNLFLGKKSLIKDDSFQMAIFDEAHKLRNLFGTPKPPRTAKAVEEAFRRQVFKYVLMLTATPVQNRIWDIYSLIHLLKLIEGEDNPLGNPRLFSYNYLGDTKGITINKNRKDTFRQILQRTICRTRRGDTKLPFPGRIVHDVPFELERHEKELYKILETLSIIPGFPVLKIFSLARGLMSSPQAFLEEFKKNPLNLQIINDWLPRVEKLVEAIPISQKMEKVLHLLEEMRERAQKESRSWRAIIFTMRLATQKQIAKCLEEKGFAYDFIQGGNPALNCDTIQKYKCEPPQINIIISTDAGAEGVNLQEGNVIINYDLPWNPMIIEQRIGRVQRLGSNFEDVIVFNPYAQNTIEEDIVERLVLKLIGISQAIGDLESILEISENEEDSFEETIKRLVLNALKGQDIEQQKKKIEQEVDRAAKYYEEHKHELDETLSATNWNEELAEENLPPEIEPQYHSMTEQEFLTKAWENNQPLYSYGEKPFGISERIWNHPEELRNSREFSDCIQEWRKKASSFVYDLTCKTSENDEWITKAWLHQFPETQIDQIVNSGQTSLDFQGHILFRAEVSNSVNRFQKVLSSPVVTLNDSIPDYSRVETIIPDDFTKSRNYNAEIAKMVPDPSALANQAVENDAGLQRFAQYYYNVLEAKQAKTEDPKIQRRNRDNFMPKFSAEMCGIQGFTYEIFPLQIHFLADSHPYSIPVQWIPLTHSFQPIETGHCEVTGIACPNDILDECQLTNQKVLPHLLVTIRNNFRVLESETAVCGICHERDLKSTMEISPVNHLWEHISHKIECSFSHKMGFPEEMDTSDFSGRIAFSQFIRVSGKSGRKGIIDEFIQCAKTNELLLKDEVMQRQADGLWYDIDLFQKSPISQKFELEELMDYCELTGSPALMGELVFCCISRQYIRKDWANESKFSHRFFNPNLGILTKNRYLLPPDEVCPICELPLLRNEEKIDHPDYERAVHADHFVESAVTGKELLKENSKRSDYSGKYAEPEYFLTSAISNRCGLESEMFRSEKSNRLGLLDEGKICSRTGKNLLSDEGCYSPTDGCWYDSDLMRKSAVSDCWDLMENMVQCEQTGTWVLPDELVSCCISGKKIRKDIMLQSPISNRLFYGNFGVKTADGKLLPPDEVCPICNLEIHSSDPCVKKTSTGRRMHSFHFVKSAVSGTIILKTEALCSDYSKKYAEKNLFQVSSSGRLGLPEEFCTCAKTGERLLKDEALFSKKHQCWYKKDLCVQSEVSAQWGLAEDLIICERSHKKMFPEESGICAVSGQRVAKKFLKTSFISGKTFLPEFGVNSTENVPLMRVEAEICHWQCGYIPKTEAGICSLCGLTFSKKYLIGNEFKHLHDLHKAITTSTRLMFRWPNIEPKFRSALYNNKNFQPGFDISSPSCLTYFLLNENQKAFVFCTQVIIRKSFFRRVYAYYFGLANYQHHQFLLKHAPLYLESSCDIWNL